MNQESGRFMKKFEGKKSHTTVLLRHGIGRKLLRIAELWKSNFDGRNRSSAALFSPQLHNRFGCPQYYGVAEVRT
jgi:hypothetical protein